MHKTDTQRLSTIMASLLKKHNLAEHIARERLLNEWESIVGTRLAKHCQPLFIDNHVLHIRTNQDAWRQELKKRSNELLALIAGKTGNFLIKKLEIV